MRLKLSKNEIERRRQLIKIARYIGLSKKQTAGALGITESSYHAFVGRYAHDLRTGWHNRKLQRRRYYT